ncbi:MAG: hypothetical protein ACYSWQ_22875 [Planctomycetota bacterium]
MFKKSYLLACLVLAMALAGRFRRRRWLPTMPVSRRAYACG